MAEHLWTSFQVASVLSDDTRGKSLALCGRFGLESDASSSKKAVLVAEKQPINKEELTTFLSTVSSPSQLVLNFQNDIYYQYETQGPGGLGSLKMTLVYPATEKHIIKYTDQQVYIVEETPEDYATISKPYIESQALSLQVII